MLVRVSWTVNMLLRTFLLFLCVSSGLCATLGLFLMQEKDQETPAQDLNPALDNVVVPVDENMRETEATGDEKTNNASAPEEDKSLLETLLENDRQPEVDKEVQDVHAAVEDVAATEEVVTESNKKTEDIVEANVVLTENDKKTEDIVEANVVPPESDKKTEDIVEANVVQEDQLPQQVEDNEIKPVPTKEVPKKPEEQPSRWSLNSIRSSFQNMNGYFDSLVELVGGRNGVCQYRCRYGELPAPRPGYQVPEPNGCSSSLVGFQLDLGIPAMTQCCNQLDSCYDTCGTSKYDCDSSFRSCLHGICSDLKKSLGLGTQYQTCESMADGLFNTVWTLGCRPYMNSQRAACVCEEEEKDEL